MANAAGGALVTAVQSIGLRSPWPSDFTTCVKVTGSFQPDCELWGGPYHPTDPYCFKNCVGLRAVRTAHAVYRQRVGAEGPVLSLRQFVHDHFDPCPLGGHFQIQTSRNWAVI